MEWVILHLMTELVNRFQFHKGAIGVLSSISSLSKYFLFQFHKGAIGVYEGIRLRSGGTPVFQFHKGAIGVVLSTSGIKLSILFQFHKGAIGVLTTTYII